MNEPTHTVKLLYYVEENEIVVHCPQLDLSLVEPLETLSSTADEKTVKRFFHAALDKKITRHENTANFLKHLELHNHLDQERNIKSFDYFLENFPYLSKTLKTPNIQSLEHTVIL